MSTSLHLIYCNASLHNARKMTDVFPGIVGGYSQLSLNSLGEIEQSSWSENQLKSDIPETESVTKTNTIA